MKIMIAGGGTGGHVYPGIALYRALSRKHQDLEVLFVGVRGGVERGILDRLDLPCLLLSGRGVRGTSLAAKLASPFVFKWAVIQAARAMLRFKPDLVVGTGGYASVSAVVAAALLGRPRILLEQNSIPGLANRTLSRIASLTLLAYEGSGDYLPAGARYLVTGNPLRFDPSPQRFHRLGILESLGLKENLPVVLLFGGSRGAASINRAGITAAGRLVDEGRAQFLFLTGERDFERIRTELGPDRPGIVLMPFHEEMDELYAVTDLAVARAGASTVTELAAFGVPAVFIPYPYAADDHQMKNAQALEAIQAAVILEDSVLDGESLTGVIRALLDDPARRLQMARRMRSWSRPEAAERAADVILDLVKKNSGDEVRVQKRPFPSPRGYERIQWYT
jgi:UDP-N-acetylglucosamine--N-acetylmuramyl-(pentapeptide) pyrophosphoryl-undecaprenol N-acetylglucosamine transferase